MKAITGAQKALDLTFPSGPFPVDDSDWNHAHRNHGRRIRSNALSVSSLGAYLARFPAIQPYSESIAFALVVAMITYLSLIIGELVPKRLALSNPEHIASILAGPLHVLSSARRTRRPVPQRLHAVHSARHGHASHSDAAAGDGGRGQSNARAGNGSRRVRRSRADDRQEALQTERSRGHRAHEAAPRCGLARCRRLTG